MDYMQQETFLFISTNVTPQKRDGRNCVFEVFSQGLEEMHHELSKDGENHTLGDVRTYRLELHPLGLHTSNFCFLVNTIYHINLERLFVCFCFYFLFCETTTLSFIYVKELLEIWVEISCMLLLYWEKGCLS